MSTGLIVVVSILVALALLFALAELRDRFQSRGGGPERHGH
jgi:hypothetical protein